MFGLVFHLILTNMWNFLVVNEPPKPADVIIVLSGDSGRAEQGVRLYQLGYAPKILFAGSSTRSMSRQAVSLGVSEEHIIIENRSRTTLENARNSLTIMQAQGFESAIVVTSAYHTRRTSIIFDKVFQGLDLTICAVPFDSSTPDTWRKDRHLGRNVISEYIKLMGYYLFHR